jgi:hypothetical protein
MIRISGKVMVDVADFSPWLIGMNRASSCHHRAISSTYPKSPIAAEEWSGRSVAAPGKRVAGYV